MNKLDKIATKHIEREAYKMAKQIKNFRACDLCNLPFTERDLSTGGWHKVRDGKHKGKRVSERCVLGGVEAQDQYTRERILSHERVCVLGLAV